jgi:hypothetical protein
MCWEMALSRFHVGGALLRTGGSGEGLDIQSVAFLNGGLLPELHRPVLTQKLLSNAYIGTPPSMLTLVL